MLQFYFPRFALVLGWLTSLGCIAESVKFDALTVAPEAQPKGEAFRKGREILNESQKAYANVESYVGALELSGGISYQPGQESFVDKRIFKIKFESPKS